MAQTDLNADKRPEASLSEVHACHNDNTPRVRAEMFMIGSLESAMSTRFGTLRAGTHFGES